MGYQGRTRRRFLGLYTTRKGTGAPRETAEDVTNIDFSQDSIRGRSPIVRAISTKLPHSGIYYNGAACTQSDYSTNNFSLSTLTDDPGNESFLVRVYVSQLDLYRLSVFAVGTRWCIAGSTGDSTDFGAGAGQTGGWAMFLEHHAQDEFRFTVHYRVTGPANQSIVVDDIELNWDSKDDVYCVEWSWNVDHTQDKLEYFINGSNTATKTATAVIAGVSILASGTHTLNIGAVALGANLDDWRYPFLGTIGSVCIHDMDVSDPTPKFRWEMIPSRFDLAGTTYAQIALAVQAEGSGFLLTPIGTSGYTNTGAGHFKLNPPPVLISSGVMQFAPGAAARFQADPPKIDLTKVWGVIGSIKVYAQMPGARGFVIGQTAIIGSGQIESPYLDWDVSIVNPSVSGFRIRVGMRLEDVNGVVRNQTSVTSADLTLGSDYRFAFFVERDFSGSVDTTTVQLWTKSAGVWTSHGTDTDPGKPLGLREIIMGPTWWDAFGCRFDVGDIRIHGNLSARPAVSADVIAIDTYPPNGKLTWPASVMASIDAAEAGSVRTENLGTGDTRQRMVHIEDNKTGVQSLHPAPLLPRSRWSAIAHLTGGVRQEVAGVHTGSRLIGSRVAQTIDVVMRGVVFRWDVDDAAGKVLTGLPMEGDPNAGVGFVDFKDRVVVFGREMSPFKIFPLGIAQVGYDPPQWAMGAGVSSAANGGLAASTDYFYRLSTYNSVTGQESNLGGLFEKFSPAHGTTSVGHDTLTFTITDFQQPRGDDWDTINVYRKAQVSGLFYLEQQIPRPKTLPTDGADIVFTSGMQESELLLQAQEQIDNHPPDQFTAAAVIGRSMVVGGGGLHPGWAYYSRPNLHESFPPINVWQLDDDDGNALVGVFRVLTYGVILKRRSVYVVRDDAPDTGEEPACMHAGPGCVNQRAAALVDNRLFFVSPDRCVYATDGVELADVSSRTVRSTLQGLTDEQLNGVQLANHGRLKQLWLSIPSLASDFQPRREILVFSYDTQIWTRYEMLHSSINTGSESGTLQSQVAMIGAPGWIYRMGTGIQARDSDTAATVLTFDYPLADYILNATNQCLGFRSTGINWHADVEGMPAIVIFYTGSQYGGTPPRDHPLWRSNVILHYTWVRKVRGTSPFELWFTNPTLPGVHVTSRALILIGSQIRKYKDQWYAPQGEDYPCTFFAVGAIQSDDVQEANNDLSMRAFVDYENTEITMRDTTETPVNREPDHTFSVRRRGRRLQIELLSGVDRTKELDVISIEHYFRVRGPRRPR